MCDMTDETELPYQSVFCLVPVLHPSSPHCTTLGQTKTLVFSGRGRLQDLLSRMVDIRVSSYTCVLCLHVNKLLCEAAKILLNIEGYL